MDMTNQYQRAKAKLKPKKRKYKKYMPPDKCLANLRPNKTPPIKQTMYTDYVRFLLTPYQKAKLLYAAQLEGVSMTELLRAFIDSLESPPEVLFE